MKTAEVTSMTQWAIDPSHSEIGFKVKHLMISNVKGVFKEFTTSVATSEPGMTINAISFSMNTASVNTGDETRDAHLRSADFFDAEKFPKMTFKSKSFKKLSGKNYEMSGDLTMKGVTKPIKFKVEFNGSIKDPMGNTRAGFKLSGKVNRYDYGLTWNKALETGGFVVGKEIKIESQIEIYKK